MTDLSEHMTECTFEQVRFEDARIIPASVKGPSRAIGYTMEKDPGGLLEIVFGKIG